MSELEHNHICIFKCEECGKTYDSNRKVFDHMRLHTKQFQCVECRKCFRKRSHLTRHESVHTAVNPFKCDFCDDEFEQSGHLDTFRTIMKIITIKMKQHMVSLV